MEDCLVKVVGQKVMVGSEERVRAAVKEVRGVVRAMEGA